MSAIELLLRLAKIREDQAMARAKRAAGQVNQTKAFKNQVLEYAKDYEIQMLGASKESMPVSFIQDANAFREKLIQSSLEMDGQIQGLSRASEETLMTATQARMRTRGLTKLVDKKRLEARKKKDKAEMNQFEDSYAARLNINSGTKDA
ncbi:flagellar export protein FliJ [Polynucleobacter sp. UB-Piko-W3]|jgi:flagellar biosynthesis chaperone FliJ|uniref:flagellar export protein FliJ n=1 Tax=Polynucleobacter sp. UB-Piko-W3 TaxID=1819735 RepID=UPI001C0C33EB|nr:flagellar FliJ family protein [Polynucleobacter sp. UB-Piko-W3]MBU3554975.1 flagellar FliJ family protein [Polynucleobacter sp. UB-Piko-W3]